MLVHDVKKNFYKKFLYEPFPVESSILNVLPDHINAEIVAGKINEINFTLKINQIVLVTNIEHFRNCAYETRHFRLFDLDLFLQKTFAKSVLLQIRNIRATRCK